jgi:PAS domain-containing protein
MSQVWARDRVKKRHLHARLKINFKELECYDLVNNRLTWSDEVQRIFGFQPAELEATHEAFLEAVHPDDRAAVDAAYSGSVCDGRDAYEIEHRVVKNPCDDLEMRVQERTSKLSEAVERLQAEIIQRKRLEETLRESENQVRFFASQCLSAHEDERKGIAEELPRQHHCLSRCYEIKN